MTQEKWWPSKYGPDDQIGMLNEITPEKIVQAARLAQRGQVFDLSRVLDEHVPAFPGRSFRQHLTTTAYQLNHRDANDGAEGLGENNVNWIVADHLRQRLGVATAPVQMEPKSD